jgi:hypothetical protein
MGESAFVRETIPLEAKNYDYSEVINALNTILSEKGGAVLSIRFIRTIWSLDDANNWIENRYFCH